MLAPSADAFLDTAAKEQIAALAVLYDRFAHALDPFSPDRDKAEQVFHQDIVGWYESIPQPEAELARVHKGNNQAM